MPHTTPLQSARTDTKAIFPLLKEAELTISKGVVPLGPGPPDPTSSDLCSSEKGDIRLQILSYKDRQAPSLII